MKRVCAWCGKGMGSKPGPKSLITHGICDACLKEVSTDPDRTMQSYLDRIPAPILLVDADGMVLTSNKIACQRLGKKLHQVRRHLGGDVMECAWSRLPGGCGRTEHCQACIIRQTVIKTVKTGRSYRRVKAYLTIMTPEGNHKKWIWISTQKLNDVVILRLDDMAEAEEAAAEKASMPIRRAACDSRPAPARAGRASGSRRR